MIKDDNTYCIIIVVIILIVLTITLKIIAVFIMYNTNNNHSEDIINNVVLVLCLHGGPNSPIIMSYGIQKSFLW